MSSNEDNQLKNNDTIAVDSNDSDQTNLMQTSTKIMSKKRLNDDGKDVGKEIKNCDVNHIDEHTYQALQNVDNWGFAHDDNNRKPIEEFSIFENLPKKIKESNINLMMETLTPGFNHGTLLKTITMMIPDFLRALNSINKNDDEKSQNFQELINVYKNKKILEQFIRNLPTYIAPVFESWPSKNELDGNFKFAWVRPSKILELILKNKYIIKQLVNEILESQNEHLEHDKKIIKSDENLGKIRIELVIDDLRIFNLSISKNGFIALYMTCLNIPTKYRLSRKNIYLLAFINKHKMEKYNYTINDVFKPIVDDFKEIINTGIPIEIVFNDNHHLHLNFNVAISSICGYDKQIDESIDIKQLSKPELCLDSSPQYKPFHRFLQYSFRYERYKKNSSSSILDYCQNRLALNFFRYKFLEKDFFSIDHSENDNSDNDYDEYKDEIGDDNDHRDENDEDDENDDDGDSDYTDDANDSDDYE